MSGQENFWLWAVSLLSQHLTTQAIHRITVFLLQSGGNALEFQSFAVANGWTPQDIDLLKTVVLRVHFELEELTEHCLKCLPFASDNTFAEISFALGFAMFRMGHLEQSELAWEQASMRAVSEQHKVSLQNRIRVEIAIRQMNEGDDKNALAEFRDLLLQPDTDTLTRVRILACLGLSAATVGQFTTVTDCLDQERAILDQLQSHSLDMAWARRCANADLIMGENDKAKNRILSLLPELTENDLALKAHFYWILCWCDLKRNDKSKSEQHIQAFRDVSNALVPGVVDLLIIQSEFALRFDIESFQAEHLSQMQDLIGTQTKKETGVKLLEQRARYHVQLGDPECALIDIELAIKISRDFCYFPVLVDLLFHASAIYFRIKQNLVAKTYLFEARDLATDMKLTLKKLCFDAILGSLRENQFGFRPFVHMLNKSMQSPEILWHLSQYGFVTNRSRLVTYACGTSTHVSEAHLWETGFALDQLVWLVPEKCLVLPKRDHVLVVDFRDSEILEQCFLLATQNAHGITLQDAHALTSAVPYNALRHEGKARSCVSRLKNALMSVGVDFAKDKVTGRYFFVNPLRLQTVN